MSAPQELQKVSIRKYAESRGVSDTWVRDMRKKGWLTERCFTMHSNGKWPMIYPEYADEDWQKNYDATFAGAPAPVGTPVPPSRPAAAAVNGAPKIPGAPAGRPEPGTKAYTDQELANIKLLQEKMNLAEKQGSLVIKQQVYRALFDIGQVIKLRILSVADKKIDEIRAAETRDESHHILTQALVDALDSLSQLQDGDINFSDYE